VPEKSGPNDETPGSNNGAAHDDPASSEDGGGDTPSIAEALRGFLCEVDALSDTLPLVMPLVMTSKDQASTELDNFLEERCQKQENESFVIPPDQYTEFTNLERRLQRNVRAVQIIPRSFFTSLISHYDAFIGNLLRAIFYMKPEVLNSSEHPLTFKELTSFNSLDAARASVVEREVEALLRESHAEQFQWMEKKFNVPLRKDLPSWPTFIEVTERRNLFVHCNGIVSPQYLSVCKRHGVDCSKVKLGQELHVGPKYLKIAYATILEIGIKLAHVLWRRLKPEEIEQADGSLNNLCLDLIRDEKYAVAQTLLDFAAQYKSFGSESARKILLLNQAQAYKWGGQDKRAKDILAGEDWNAANEKFQLGAAVLNDDFETASQIMRHIGPDSSPGKGDYKEWPIFKIFRESPEFAAAYENVFGEPFGSVTASEISEKKEIDSAGAVEAAAGPA
jgi:hypothetical protein